MECWNSIYEKMCKARIGVSNLDRRRLKAVTLLLTLESYHERYVYELIHSERKLPDGLVSEI